jgi:N6-L-threonylcarbamoyladenine synthase
MLMLGIESSCDETAASVVAEVDDPSRPWQIRSNVVASQVEIHREWGGVVPELASRQHIRDICGVVEKALSDARVTLRDIGAVAVTEGPGLVGSLLVGLSFAKSLASSLEVPLVPVHHLAGHIESLFLEHGLLPLPSVVLVVSGGHTSLYEVPAPGVYHLIGKTRDDAAGEAYDKVAKLLGLGYPGGPVVDRVAREGNDRAIDFPIARMTHRDRNEPRRPGRLDFSFSGIKTSVIRYVRSRQQAAGSGQLAAGSEAEWASGVGLQASGDVRASGSGPQASDSEPRASGPGTAVPLGRQEIADICASFQRAVVDALLDRTFEAASRIGARSVGIAGGVSANNRLRADSQARGARTRLPVFVPPLALSTDNAAMIAAAGLRRFHMGVRAGWDLNADASLRL